MASAVWIEKAEFRMGAEAEAAAIAMLKSTYPTEAVFVARGIHEKPAAFRDLVSATTLAGAVRYIPNRPSFDGVTLDTHARGYALNQSDDLGWNADATLNLPLVDDVLAFRGTVGYREEAGFVDYDFLVREPGVSDPEPDFGDPAAVDANLRSVPDADDEQTLTVRGALLWNATDAVQAILTYHFQNQDVGARTINHRDAFGTGRYVSGHRFLEPNERENQLLSLEINADLGFATLTSATGFVQYEEQGQRDQTDLLLNFEYGYEDFPAFAAFTREDGSEDTITQELRLVSQNDSRWNWIVGGFYREIESDFISQEFTPGIPEFFGIAPPPLPTGDLEYQQLTDETLEELAVFGEIGYQITDRWQVTGGLRWFEYENDLRVAVDLPLIGIVDSPFEQRITEEDDVTWRINTSWDVEESIDALDAGTVYVNVAEGYRLGGGNVFASCPDPLPPGQNVCLLPEEESFLVDTAVNYEIGAKTEWLDNRLLVNLSLFYVTWEDVQIDSRSVNGDVPITLNAAEAVSQGVELQTRWQITDQWAVFGSYAYTRAELSEDSPGIVGVRDAPPNADAFDGDRLPGTPEHQGSFNVNYSRPAFGNLTLDVNYGLTAISDVYTKVGLRGSGEVLGGFTIHNASVSLSDDRWTATLYADNLFDKFARTGVRTDSDYVDTIEDFTLRRYFHHVTRPRAIGLDFRYRFDL